MCHIRDAGDRMAMLIDTVSAYTQLDGESAPNREVFSLDEAVSAAAANLSALFSERGATVSVDSLPFVTANRVQITQVLQNLMSNAVSHSADPVRISVQASCDGTLVRVVLRDNGPGIALENQRKIFEPFQRLNRDNHHSGLGLAITQKIVEAHGGKIGCDSIIGEGSSFHFALPGALAAVDEPVTVALVAMPALVESSMLANVLLVDDSEGEIKLAHLYITAPIGMRCNFLVAHDGKEGLAMIRDQGARNDPVDLILLDINMPVMNGFQMLEAMATDAAYSRIPVVMCSGSTREEDKSRARALGAVAYLIKTVRFEQLEPVIAAIAGVRLTLDEDGARSLVRAG
jgi:two-component system CheB/CheR fusion protein